jgi:SpoIID/LytB domain protein
VTEPVRSVVATLIVLMLGAVAIPPAAAETTGPYRSVTVVPADGVTLSWNGKHYAGSLEIAAASDGLIVRDHVGVDDYLLGIQEVPFSWPEAALRAQAVAARTYLAWTLRRGRAGSGATYGFDICASSACQVYGGLDLVTSAAGRRWEEAVESTAGEILVYDGAPALTMYSSTTGGRTRNYEDVYPDRAPIPYLKAVPSPGEQSAFADWHFEVRGSVLEDILAAAGVIDGPLHTISVRQTADGEGPWIVEVESDGGTEEMSTTDFRGLMNRWASDLYPDVFPAFRPSGTRYPQTILSPTYVIRKTWHFPDVFRSGHIDVYPVYEFDGHGWGHMVGMSQYGARAMADAGADYRTILSHYYGGLLPQPAGDLLPDSVVVGLDWKQAAVRVSADGPVDIMADGQVIAEGAVGTWDFRAGTGVMMTPPEGFGLPPTFGELPDHPTGTSGRSLLLSVVVTAPSEVRLVVFRGAQVVQETPWKVREAGHVSLIWDGSVAGSAAPPGPYRLMIEARNGEGTAVAFVTALVTS